MRPADLAAANRTRESLASGDAKRAREASGARQKDIAEAIGVSRSAVGLWEAGRRKPGNEHALAYGRLIAKLQKGAP